MIVAILIAVLGLVVLGFMWSNPPECGAYDPADYRCGKCSRCYTEAEKGSQE